MIGLQPGCEFDRNEVVFNFADGCIRGVASDIVIHDNILARK